MQTKVTLALALGLVLSWDDTAQAHFTSGNDLLKECTAREGEATYYQSSAYCTAYITGAADALDAERYMTVKSTCIPSGVTAGQLRDIVVAYLQANPTNRHISGYLLVNLALIGAFDCTFKRGSQ